MTPEYTDKPSGVVNQKKEETQVNVDKTKKKKEKERDD